MNFLISRNSLKIFPQAINIRAFSSNDNPGPSGVNIDTDSVAGTLDLNFSYRGLIKGLQDMFPHFNILMKKF
jgi:hypothetical protein